MRAASFRNATGRITVRHRAVCDEGDYRGNWHSDASSAEADALRHTGKPGNETHRVWIETEQKTAILVVPQ